jgi:EpsI family protein
MLATLILANLMAYGWIYPMRKPLGKVKMEALPLHFGEWQGEDMEVDPDVYRILRADIILSRRYRRGQETVEWMVVIARNRRDIHLPTSCYRVGGWVLSPEHEIELLIEGQRVPWHEVRVEKEGYAMLVWYTFSNGKRTTPRWLQQQWFMALDQIQRERYPWAQLHLTTPLNRGSESEARQRMEEFLHVAFPETQRILREAEIED